MKTIFFFSSSVREKKVCVVGLVGFISLRVNILNRTVSSIRRINSSHLSLVVATCTELGKKKTSTANFIEFSW